MSATDTSRDLARAARPDILKALGWMAIALLSFSAFAVAGREAGREIGVAQIMLWRGPLSLVLLTAIAATMGLRPRTTKLKLHVVRSCFHFVSQSTWLTALALIPLAELFALEFTAPLWVALLAPFVLGERLTAVRIGAAALGFLGVLVVVQPGAQPVSMGTLLGLLSAVGFAASMLTTKILTRTDTPFTILVYMMILQTIFGFAVGIWTFVVPSLATFGWLVALAVIGLVAHFSLAQAFRSGDAVLVAPMDFARLPLIAAVGALFYGEVLQPTLLVGASIIVAANLLNILSERRSKP